MSEERLKEIKDSFNIKFIEGCRSIGKGITIQHINQELELYNEVIRLREENKDNGQLIETQLRGLEKQKQIIKKAVEYIKRFDLIIGYYDYNDEGYDEIGENNNLQQELLNILNGRSDE